MYTPFKSLASPSDVASLLDDDSKLVYPLCDNTLFIISKCVDLDTDDYVGFNNNEATIAGLFIKQVKLSTSFIKHTKITNCICA